MNKDIYDAVIIGAGAAGLMAAIQLGRLKRRVILIDGQKTIGAKILMSGGTRCNVTNRITTEKDYNSEKLKVVRNILRFYPSSETINFFESLGLKIKEESNGQCYPATESGETVLKALVGEIQRLKVRLLKNCRALSIETKEKHFFVKCPDEILEARSVVIATGGLSYPNTGSDGSGYQVAQASSHELIETSPALTPLTLYKSIWTSLRGISTDVEFTLWVDNKKYMTKRTSLLFTHFGMSGLGVLDLSRHWERLRKKHDVRLTVNFIPDELAISDFFAQYAKVYPKRTLKRFLTEQMPERLSEAVCCHLKIDAAVVFSQMLKDDRKRLLQFLSAWDVPVKGVMGYQKAEATAGGVALDGVHSKSLESKNRSGLFFCGEVLDVDGRIGGFNFQWAWSSAVVAAQGVDQFLKSV